MDFQDLLDKSPKSKVEILLCQAIATLSTQKDFSHMAPWEVFDYVERTSSHWDSDH